MVEDALFERSVDADYLPLTKYARCFVNDKTFSTNSYFQKDWTPRNLFRTWIELAVRISSTIPIPNNLSLMDFSPFC